MIKFFLARVLMWAASIDWGQFIMVVGSVKAASIYYPKAAGITPEQSAEINLKRAEMVGQAVARFFPSLPTWTMNLLRELAVAWCNRSTK